MPRLGRLGQGVRGESKDRCASLLILKGVEDLFILVAVGGEVYDDEPRGRVDQFIRKLVWLTGELNRRPDQLRRLSDPRGKKQIFTDHDHLVIHHEPWREASRSRPEGGANRRRTLRTLRIGDDRERRAATLIGTANRLAPGRPASTCSTPRGASAWRGLSSGPDRRRRSDGRPRAG